jgi:hypothetical protein
MITQKYKKKDNLCRLSFFFVDIAQTLYAASLQLLSRPRTWRMKCCCLA